MITPVDTVIAADLGRSQRNLSAGSLLQPSAATTLTSWLEQQIASAISFKQPSPAQGLPNSRSGPDHPSSGSAFDQHPHVQPWAFSKPGATEQVVEVTPDISQILPGMSLTLRVRKPPKGRSTRTNTNSTTSGYTSFGMLSGQSLSRGRPGYTNSEAGSDSSSTKTIASLPLTSLVENPLFQPSMPSVSEHRELRDTDGVAYVTPKPRCVH